MHTFKDTEGRTWNIVIHAGTLARVKAMASCDLLTVLDDNAKLLGRLYDDLYLLVEVAWAICQPDAEKRSPAVTADQFAAALGGDVLLALADAIVEELADFFPDARKRAILREFVKKAKEAADQITQAMEQAISQVDVALIAQSAIGSSGSSPEKSESTPTA